METIMDMFKGYKTYIAALGFACLGLVALMDGDMPKAAEHFMLAMAAFGLRQAVNGLEKK